MITRWMKVLVGSYTLTPDFGVFVKRMLVGTLPRYTPPAVPAGPAQPAPPTN